MITESDAGGRRPSVETGEELSGHCATDSLPMCVVPGPERARSLPRGHEALQLLEQVDHQVHLPWGRSRSRGVAEKHQELPDVGRHVVLIAHIVDFEQDGRASERQRLAERREGRRRRVEQGRGLAVEREGPQIPARARIGLEKTTVRPSADQAPGLCDPGPRLSRSFAEPGAPTNCTKMPAGSRVELNAIYFLWPLKASFWP
jgi:hypothetical protein